MRKLEVGQSFTAEDHNAETVNSAFQAVRKNHPERKFMLRTIDGVVRAWRVK